MFFSIAAPHVAVGTAASAPSARADAPSPGSASAKKVEEEEAATAAARRRTSAPAVADRGEERLAIMFDSGGERELPCVFPCARRRRWLRSGVVEEEVSFFFSFFSPLFCCLRVFANQCEA